MTTEAEAEVPAPIPAVDPDGSYGRLMPVAVHFDDLDSLGMLHNARYPLLVERAWNELWQGYGLTFDGDWAAAGDFCNVVRELRISYEAPVGRPGAYAVHLWLERLGTTGLTYGFRLCSADGEVTYARGTRVLVRLDAGTLRPTPWSDWFRACGQELLRPAE
ncbi:acyl-CoA thioester hydrolase, YbgC/YbaW family [Streptomyces turgidiscabies Car8]|uniref:Acyl-CoA thioester hydrolase, YbgC/YbaW family n=2 Tax=Streptomyces TaxID=1883 RepID=L7F7H3_STRT8|nr:acyl-CoA thioester hydrolase, YbgC/YbaW family [Streptomyces turgidiscabies Car8]GAQ76387.1 acyl-CoA thioesterase YbgC [Streptomyces turgidiscabies]